MITLCKFILHYIILTVALMVGIILDHWWIFWIIIELSLWALVPFLFSRIRNLIEFIFWQCLSSLMFIVLFVVFKSKRWIIALIFKISLPPFHLWFLRFIKSISWKGFLIYVYFRKIPHIWILSSIWLQSFLWLLISFPIFIGVYFWIIINLKYIIWAVSIVDYPWRYLLSKRNHLLTIYSLILVLVILIFFSLTSKLNNLILILILRRLPPFSIFHIKILRASIIFQLKILILIVFSIMRHLFIWLVVYLYWYYLKFSQFSRSPHLVLIFTAVNLIWFIF